MREYDVTEMRDSCVFYNPSMMEEVGKQELTASVAQLSAGSEDKHGNDTRRGWYADAVTSVEVILVLVVLLAVVVIFREQLLSIVNGIFNHVNESINGLY